MASIGAARRAAAPIEPVGVHLVFGRLKKILGGEPEPDAPSADAPAPVELEVMAYAQDCVIEGRLDLAGDRLTDMLNESASVTLRDVTVKALEDGHTIKLLILEVARDELLGMSIGGQRGNAGRRQVTRTTGVALTAGPFEIWGYLHSAPIADPLSPLVGTRQMVPIMTVALRYQQNGITQLDRHEGLIVNGSLVETANAPMLGSDSLAALLDAEFGVVRRRMLEGT